MRRLGALAAAVLAAGAIACDRAPDAAPDPTAAEVVAAARAQGLARVRVLNAIVHRGVPEMSATGTGILDIAGERSALTVEYDAKGEALGFRTHEEVVVGDLAYLRRPGGRWFRARLPAGGTGPYAAVAALAVAGPLVRVGEETVGGRKTVRYAAAGRGPLVRRIELWVTRDALPVRLRVERPENLAPTTTVDFEAFGVAGRVDAPARSTPVASPAELYAAVGE